MTGKTVVGMIVLVGVSCAGGRVEALSNKKIIGELERLGKDGRDWLVVGAEAGGFDDLEWRDNVKARAAKLKLPNGTAFVFPQLIPVAGGKGRKELVDVRLVYEEDLTAQPLRWSRLSGVSDEWTY